MATIRILVPDGTTNYILNPQFRYATTGWNAAGSTITRVLTQAKYCIASLKVVTNGALLNEGVYYRVNALQGISEPITVSAYVLGSGIVRIRLIDNPAGSEWKSQPVALSPTTWKRISISGFSTGSNDLRLYIETAHRSGAKAITFYVDGAQMERKAYPTTYVDGDQEGCRWNGRAHESSSTRPASERSGGRWATLASPDMEIDDLYVTVVGGLGVAPIENVTNPFSILNGSYWQNVKITDRVITLNFHAKYKDFRKCSENSLKRLHSLRRSLYDILKPDKAPNSEFILEYQDGDSPIYLRARYDGGMTGDWDIRNKWVTSFPVRLLAVSPMAWEDTQNVYAVDYQENFLLNNVAGRIDGQWSRMNYGFNGDVNDFEIGSRGELIAAGSFTVANNNAAALDPLIGANRIAYWDGTKWVAYGAGANGAINDIAVAPNGYVYVTGAFTSIGGVAANRVAYWDGAAWNAMGLGLNDEGYNITVAPNGHVYVGGKFTTAGGNNAYYIARWTGAAWFAMGPQSGLNNYVYTVAISQNGLLLYAGGNFTDENTNPGSGLTRVAVYDIQGGTWDSMGNGFNGIVYEIIISPTGVIYAGGAFSLSGSETVNYISQWNGSAWIALSSGVNGTVYSMSVSPRGDLVAVGLFSQAAAVATKKIALWNGSTWTNMDIDIGQGNVLTQIYAVQFMTNGDLFVGGTQFSNGFPTLCSGITTVTNTGTATVAPRFYILGPATLRWLENQTNQVRMFLNLSVLSGEEVFIDIATSSIQSTIRGNLSYSILQGSDFRNWLLLPGENKVAAFMEDDIAASMQIRYVPSHWGVDSTMRSEEL